MVEQKHTPSVLTVAEVADRLRVSDLTVYRLIHAGKLSAFKVGQLWRITEDDLGTCIQEQKNKNAGSKDDE